jgi:hypothetical protein
MVHHNTHPISFIYAPMASMWAITLHSLFLYLDPPPPPPSPSPSVLLTQAIFKRNLFPYKYLNILKPSHSSYLPAYEDGTECSEISTHKIQTPGDYTEESIKGKNFLPFQDLNHGCDMIYLTAVGLPLDGSSTVHIYTQTIHRTTQNKQYIEQHNKFWKSGGCAPSWRVIPWHLPYTRGKSAEKPQSDHPACSMICILTTLYQHLLFK